MTPTQVDLIKKSWAQIDPFAGLAANVFYDTLFEQTPELRELFMGADMLAQQRKLVSAIRAAVASLDQPDELAVLLQVLGARRAGYGVRDEDYEAVGQALLCTLAAGLKSDFDPATQDAWTAAYAFIAEHMQLGAAQMAA